MVIVDSKSQLEVIFSYSKSDLMIIPVWSDHKKHPALNTLSLFYIYNINKDLDFTVIIDHFDSIYSVSLEDLKSLFISDNKKFVFQKKDLLFHIPNQVNTFDLETKKYLNDNSIEIINTTESQTFFYRKYYQFENLNTLVPLFNLIEYCTEIKDKFIDDIKIEISSSDRNYNNIVIPSLQKIESSGLYFDKEEFKKFYPQKKSVLNQDYLYSQYNLFTLTGRPSNKFGGINFSALNKENGVRKIFVSRFQEKGSLIEFDFDAYHLQIIANQIGYKFPSNVNIHTYLGRIYFGKENLTIDEYEQSKKISFRLVYGGIDKDFEKIDFFKDVNIFINDFFGKLNKNNYINTPFFERKFSKEHVTDFNKYKAWNYLIQLLETEQSFFLLNKLFEKIDEFKSKLILYTYDSFLFDVLNTERDELIKIVFNTLENHNFHLKIKEGKNYHELHNI